MFVFLPLGASVGLLVSLVLLKTGADVYLYRRAHSRAEASKVEPGGATAESEEIST